MKETQIKHEQIKLSSFLTADEARKIANKNTKTQSEIDKETLSDIFDKIKSDALLGGDNITVRADWVNSVIKDKLEAYGYKVIFEKGRLLMDKDCWRISWAIIELPKSTGAIATK